MLHAALAETAGGIRLVHHEKDRLLTLVPEGFEGIDRGAGVGDRHTHVGDDQQDDRRGIEDRERVLGQPGRRIDDDVIVMVGKERDRIADLRRGDEVRLFRARGREQDRHAARALPERLHEIGAHRGAGRQIDDGAGRRRNLKKVPHRAELHHPIEEGDRRALATEHAGEIDRDGGLSGAPLGRVDGDDLALALALLILVPTERDGELVGSAGKHEHRVDPFLGTRVHRTLRHGDHDDAGAG